jgi:hypothetical protein
VNLEAFVFSRMLDLVQASCFVSKLAFISTIVFCSKLVSRLLLDLMAFVVKRQWRLQSVDSSGTSSSAIPNPAPSSVLSGQLQPSLAEPLLLHVHSTIIPHNVAA